MVRVLTLILSFVCLYPLHAMESNNNNENKLVEIPTLKNICAKLITQLLTQDIIKPEQVAYSLPIELVTLIKDQFPQKAFITKS